MNLDLHTSKFKRVPFRLRFKLNLPQYPPQTIILILIAVNLLMSFISQNPSLYQLLLYIYGSLMLFDESVIAFHLKATMFINGFIIWCNLQVRTITIEEQKIIFGVFALLYIRILGLAIFEVIKSLVFMTPVRFQHVFWTMQLGVFFNFFYHFTGVTSVRYFLSVIRIFQNLQVMSVKSMIGTLRMSLKILQFFLLPWSFQWIFLQIFMGFWDTYNDFSKQFVMSRLYKNQTCFYPKPLIISLFIIDVLMIWTWPIPDVTKKSTAKVIRRICWNYVKLESRASESPDKQVLLHILQYYTNKQIDDICL